MPDYRRWYVPGGTYFFTVVTYRRTPFLCDEMARRLLRESMELEAAKRPFEMHAIVLLPDHLHSLWTLPPDDDKYSQRWSAIKAEFTRNWLRAGGCEGRVTAGEHGEQRRGVWQPRFMEHTIRDEDDFENHFNYIHYNPARHGHVVATKDWPWSTFHKYVQLDVYSPEWGTNPMDFPSVDEDLLE
ncbi:MAG: transposase [Candidatus Nealsonbacteria bacterium]|nr:transposase [Candidatus Nealsonbacteria bacterium]